MFYESVARRRLALTEGHAGSAVTQRTAIFPLRDGNMTLALPQRSGHI